MRLKYTHDAAYLVLQGALFMPGFYLRPKVSCVQPYDCAVLSAHMQYAHLSGEILDEVTHKSPPDDCVQ